MPYRSNAWRQPSKRRSLVLRPRASGMPSAMTLPPMMPMRRRPSPYKYSMAFRAPAMHGVRIVSISCWGRSSSNSTVGRILSLDDVPWGSEHAWAPCACEYQGRFYFYFVCEGQVGAAVSDSPYGPFRSTSSPIVAADDFPGYPIDPAVFRDDDGTDWLLWGNRIAYAAPLNDDHVTIDASRAFHWVPGDFREAIWIFKRSGHVLCRLVRE